MTRNAQRAPRRTIVTIAAAALACAVLAGCNPPADQMIGAEREGAVAGGPNQPGKTVGSMPKNTVATTTSTIAATTTIVPSTTGAPSTTAAPSTAAPVTSVPSTNEMQTSTTSTSAKPAANAGPRSTTTVGGGSTSTTSPSTTAPATTSPPTTAPPTTAPAVPPGNGGACPSGVCAPAAPAGWRQVFVDEFSTDVAVGSFPSAVSSKWRVYDDGWSDTSGKGRYSPSKVLSVTGGVLDYYIHTENGVHMVSAPLPKIPGATNNSLLEGRYSMRFRADSMSGYKLAALLWPASDVWPRDGEIDFPEGAFGGRIGAYTHYQGATSGSDQQAFELDIDWNQWHTATIERTSSTVSYYIDGVLVGRSTDRLPSTPMQWVLQAETTLSGDTPASTAGHFQIDWVTVEVPA